MLKISIIGTGNVGWHLAHAIHNSIDFELIEVIGRTDTSPPAFKDLPYASRLTKTRPCDIYILCLPDGLIESYSNNFLDDDTLILHTSGSTPISALQKVTNYGVLYPLQTLTKNRYSALEDVPFLIEADSEKNLNLIYDLARGLSKRVIETNSSQRAHLHFAAVMANNFNNHLLYLTENYCRQHQVSFNLLKPLLAETLNKAYDLGPYSAQTGPARRGDYNTLKRQLENLNNPQLENLYKNITDSILNTYGGKKL